MSSAIPVWRTSCWFICVLSQHGYGHLRISTRINTTEWLQYRSQVPKCSCVESHACAHRKESSTSGIAPLSSCFIALASRALFKISMREFRFCEQRASSSDTFGRCETFFAGGRAGGIAAWPSQQAEGDATASPHAELEEAGRGHTISRRSPSMTTTPHCSRGLVLELVLVLTSTSTSSSTDYY